MSKDRKNRHDEQMSAAEAAEEALKEALEAETEKMPDVPDDTPETENAEENPLAKQLEEANAKTAEENMLATLAACATTPVYVVPVAGSPIPKLTATATAGTYGKVVKLYTIPNGGLGVKYEIVHL